MRSIFRSVVVISFLTSIAASAGVLDDVWLKGVTDRAPLSYGVNDKISFVVTPMGVRGEIPDGAYFLDWKRTGDDGLVETGRVPLVSSPFRYRTRLVKSGFVRLQVYVVDAFGKRYRKSFTGDASTPEGQRAMNEFERKPKEIFFDGGAGADVAKLRGKDEPKDFDAFWSKQYARLDKVSIRAERRELPCGNDKARLYAVSVRCAGLRDVTGYLSVPKACETGMKFPCRLVTHGYDGGIRVQGPPRVVRHDMIEFDINAHGMRLPAFGGTESDLKMLRRETRSHDMSYAFDPKQNADPETAYFNGMVLRIKRALQYLKTLDGWDGKNLLALGGSQGGLQSIWAAACGEGVTSAESYVTWGCDMYTTGKLRLDPALHLSGDGWYIPWAGGLGYYDAVNFAKRIPNSCHVNLSRAGLGDYCCPPMGIAKLWNAIPGNKSIRWVQGAQHGYVPPPYEGRDFSFKDVGKNNMRTTK